MFATIGVRNSMNLGDQIQSIATERLLMEFAGDSYRHDLYCERDTNIFYLMDRDEILNIHDKVNVVYNGWFDGNWTSFPPPNNINPLFIGYHINEVKKNKEYQCISQHKVPFKSLAHSDNAKYYNKYLPIGARDNHTCRILRKAGVDDVYFSGCLTMTLSPKRNIERKGIYIIDVSTDVLKKHGVPKNIVDEANINTNVYEGLDLTNEYDKRIKANQILDNLETAQLVITSRLHCALPCLAFGTPVIFHHKKMRDPRFRGLINTIPVLGRDFIDWSNWKNLQNTLPDNWDSQVKRIREIISKWVNDCKFDKG